MAVDPIILVATIAALAMLGGAVAMSSRIGNGRGLREIWSRKPQLSTGGTGAIESPTISPGRAIVPSVQSLPSIGAHEPPIGPVSPIAGPPPNDQIARLVDRLHRLESRIDELDRATNRRNDELRRELRTGLDDLNNALQGIDGRLGSGFERFRGELKLQLAGLGATHTGGPRDERRIEAIGALYLALARLESAIAQVTNPILLPGEPYAPPTEFLPESLAWENWKDVGERAFSFADAYSVQRLNLSPRAQQELAAFVTMLRGVLTRSIYPSLVPDPTDEQLDALRDALNTLAAQLPRIRRTLEHESWLPPGEDVSGSETEPRT